MSTGIMSLTSAGPRSPQSAVLSRPNRARRGLTPACCFGPSAMRASRPIGTIEQVSVELRPDEVERLLALERKFAKEGLTFDDVLLVPAESAVLPNEVSTRTKFTRQIELEIPIVSAAMDTVTEARMAIALAREGGIGIVHRNLSVQAQAGEIDKVKRSEAGMIVEPVTLRPRDRSVTGSTIIPASERFTLSISPACACTERLRWTIPMPPSRARAIAMRASVTVSIAADTIGISSSIWRVNLVRVETSLGRTADSAGTRRTSSKVRPSLANLRSSARSRSTSSGRSSTLTSSIVPIGRDALIADGPKQHAGVRPRRALFGRLSTADCGLRGPADVRDMIPVDMPRGQTPVS